MADTHFSKLNGTKRRLEPGVDVMPLSPREGDFYFDSLNNRWAVYVLGFWRFRAATTTTSTSTSTTTTSTSTTTTSTSTSSTTSTSTSTSTSTTTTL